MLIQQSLEDLDITLDFSGLEPCQGEQEVQFLYTALSDLDGIQLSRVNLDQSPDRAKAAGDFVWGLLKLKVSARNLTKLFRFLGDRLGNKPLKMKVKSPSGSEIELEASSREEFDFILLQAKELLKETN